MLPARRTHPHRHVCVRRIAVGARLGVGRIAIGGVGVEPSLRQRQRRGTKTIEVARAVLIMLTWLGLLMVVVFSGETAGKNFAATLACVFWKRGHQEAK